MLQLLETPPRFSSPPSASCPPSIAGSPPSSASGFGSYELPSPQSATTSINSSASCGSSPPKSMSPGHHTPKYYRSQPSSPRHRSPRASISSRSGGVTKQDPPSSTPFSYQCRASQTMQNTGENNTVIRGTVNLLILLKYYEIPN